MAQANRKLVINALFYGIIFIAAALFCVIYFKFFTHPFGWDVSYYINKITLLEEGFDVRQRVGFIFLSEILVLMLGAAPLEVFLILPLALFLLFNAFISLIFFQAFDRSRTAFLVCFLMLLVNARFLNTLIGLFDNLFAFTLMAFSFYILVLPMKKDYNNPRLSILLFLLLVAIGMTHIHTFAYMFGIIGLFFVLSVSWKKFQSDWKRFRGLLAALAGAMVAALMLAGSIFLTMVKNRITPAESPDASIPYAEIQESTISGYLLEIMSHHELLIGLNIFLVLFVIGAFFLAYKKGANPAKNIILCWLAVSYGIFLFALMRGSIPINRAAAYFPVFFIAVFGLVGLIELAKTRNKRTAAVILFIAFFMAGIAFFSTLLDREPTLELETINRLDETRRYIENEGIKKAVFVIQVPDSEEAAGAFANLWTFWINSSMRRIESLDYCVYFGEAEDVLEEKYPSTRKDNTGDYDKTSAIYARCLEGLDRPYEVILYRDFNTDDFKKFESDAGWEGLAKGVISTRAD